jgi:formylglycine-generating enzyme required for sulfatase activity
MKPETRSSLILYGFFVAGLALTIAWVSLEAFRVRREREARRLQSRPETGELVRINAGGFTMGSIDGAPDEKPIHDVKIRAFWIDRTEVTNEEFARFVGATTYVTLAERPRPDGRPGGAFVFAPTGVAVTDFTNELQWWRFVPGANWRHPDGPDSSIADASGILSCRWRGKTQLRTRSGRASACRRRPSGNTRRVAVLIVSAIPGAMN